MTLLDDDLRGMKNASGGSRSVGNGIGCNSVNWHTEANKDRDLGY
jgi:hypothetical protein